MRFLSQLFKGRPVTIKGILVADDMRSLIDQTINGDIDKLDALIILKHYRKGETKMGLAGDASASDMRAMQLLLEGFDMVFSGHADGELEKEKRP